jgi:hypothetical protein
LRVFPLEAAHELQAPLRQSQLKRGSFSLLLCLIFSLLQSFTSVATVAFAPLPIQ